MLNFDDPYAAFFFWFAIVCLILAAFLLLWPRGLMAANRRLKKWISTESLEKTLNRTRDIDQQLIGLRKVMGVILLVLAAVFLVLLFR